MAIVKDYRANISVTLDRFETIHLKMLLEQCLDSLPADNKSRESLENYLRKLRAAIYQP